jgi:lipopolysaccharide/colanic/teichoic acid biosynthesis glycosyltransferase
MSASRRLQLGLKRAFDVVASLTVLAALAPFILVVILLIGLQTDGLVFITTRKRYYGREVPVLRFPTDKCRGNLLQFLIRSKADLIPSLMSVLRGNLSIVGPNFQNEHVVPPRYFEALHNSPLKPGVIGPTMRCHTAKLMPTQIDADYHYVSHWSLGLDVKVVEAFLFSNGTWRN